jgi:RNA polymerase-binding transcription factor DksA
LKQVQQIFHGVEFALPEGVGSTKFQKRADKNAGLMITYRSAEAMKTAKKNRSKQGTAKVPPKRKARASNTMEILGGSGPNPNRARISSKWATHYRHLTDLRDQLLVQAGKLAKEATEEVPSYSMHMADAGTDSFDRDFALSMLSSDQDALYEIEEAIKRIEGGSYGVCELTGKPIPKDRLEAIPWARFSADTQRQLEREGALKRRQLSAFSSLPAVESTETEEGEEGAAEAGEKE